MDVVCLKMLNGIESFSFLKKIYSLKLNQQKMVEPSELDVHNVAMYELTVLRRQRCRPRRAVTEGG